MSEGKTEESVLDPELVIEQLTVIGIQKLRMIARVYSKPFGFEEADLLQEALVKVLEGERKCPADLDVLVFFKGVLRSLVDNQHKRNQRRFVDSGRLDISELSESIADESQSTPEELLIDNEREKKFWEYMENECKGEQKVLKVLEGSKFHSLRGKKLCEFAGINESQLPTILKRINRMLAKYGHV